MLAIGRGFRVKISSIEAVFQNNTTRAGAIQDASLRLDATSRWSVTADSVLRGLTVADPNAAAISCIEGNGHSVRYDSSAPANRWLNRKTYPLAKGGRLLPQ